MIRRVGIASICGMLFLGLSLPNAISASNTPGSKCTKTGVTAKSGLLVVKCEKVGSKLVWKMISISRVISPADRAAAKVVQAAKAKAKASADKAAASKANADKLAIERAAANRSTPTPPTPTVAPTPPTPTVAPTPPTPTVAPTPPTPGIVTLISGPSISPGGGPPGTVDTFTYAIQNTGGSSMVLPVVFIGVRDPSGNNMDAGCAGGTNVTLAPGAIFTCTATKTFPSAATYTWFADYQSADLVFHQLSNIGTVGIIPLAPPPPPTTLQVNQTLTANQLLKSDDGRFQAIMQGDGNFVLYGPSGAMWASQTASAANAGAWLVMQSDGNLVIYTANNVAIWSSSTNPSNGDYLAMQGDGNLVLYSGNNVPLWATNTTTGQSQGTTGAYPDADAVACGYSDWCKGGKDISSRGFVYRNCTDFVAWKLGVTWGGLQFPNGDGNAEGWIRSPKFTSSPTPRAGAVAWSGAGFAGHVAYVTGVNPNGTINLEEYNYSNPPSGLWDSRSNVAANAYTYLYLK